MGLAINRVSEPYEHLAFFVVETRSLDIALKFWTYDVDQASVKLTVTPNILFVNQTKAYDSGKPWEQ